MKFLYRIGIALYLFFARVASPFSKKISLFVSGRKNLLSKIEESLSPEGGYIWFHCPSVGEFEQVRPIIQRYKERGGADKIIITFFSPSGYELRKNYEYADGVFYLPMDTPSNAKRFLDIVKPKIAVFAKYDYWYYYLTFLKQREIPTYIVSAIFRGNQPFFKRWGGLFREMLGCFTTLYLQNEESRVLLEGIGVRNVVVAGDSRFDRVNDIVCGASKDNQIVSTFAEGKRCFVAGSTWEEDEKNIADVLEKSSFSLILAPHEVYPDHISAIKRIFSRYDVVSYSDNPSLEQLKKGRVLIVDCIGLLSSLYKYGEFAYIGGGFGAGIHNILEAATYGKGVIFGPNHNKFQEAKDLLALKGAITYKESSELYDVIAGWESDIRSLENVSKISKKYVQQHIGASDIFLKEVFSL